MTLRAYLLRGAAARLAVALPAATLLYWIFDVGDRGRLLAEHHGWRAALAASALHLPLIAVLVLPAALLLSLALWLSRLRSRGELEAAATLGRGPRVTAPPLLLLGALCTLAALGVNELLVPPCERAAARLTARARSALTGLATAPGWRRQAPWLLHRAAGGGLLALRLDERMAIRERIEGQLAPSPRPQIRGAQRVRLAAEGFDSTTGDLPLPAAWGRALAPAPRVEARGFASLRRGLARGAAAGRQRRIEALALHSKLAFPLLNLVLAAAAVSFAFGPRTRPPIGDLLRAGALLLALWALFAGGWMLCRSGLVGPAAGAWLPLGSGALLAAGLIARAARGGRGGA